MSDTHQGSTCEPWITSDDVTDCGPCADLAGADVEPWLQVASDVLNELSGRQFPGICNGVVHPVTPDDCYGPPRRLGSLIWTRMRPNERVGTTWRKRITLGVYPIVTVDEVMVDGAVLDPSAYRVDSQRFLERIDGGVWPWVWPDWQQDPSTFRVEVTYGQEPPPAGKAAAAVLACQLALSCTAGAEGCVLPERVTSMTRQGVSMAILDPMDFLEAGRTGLYLVDLFLATANPDNLRRAPQILSPDVGPQVRRYPPDTFS